jgi:MFS transporter, MHS family, shikimate and dehydroshikimate transport protein
VTIGTVASIGTAAMFALLSDRIGRRPVVLYGALATALVVFPIFWIINLGNPLLLVVVIGLYIPLIMIAAPTVMPVLLSELFETDVRYTGVSLSYQFAQMIGSGFSPVIAASLPAWAGGGTNFVLIAVFVVVVALGSALAVRRAPETRDVEFTTGPPRSADLGVPPATAS